MVGYKDSIKKIEIAEATDIAYVKIGYNSKKLIVSFASNYHDGFERKSSLMKLRYERNDFDVLYLRNRSKWYLGQLTGIGETVNHTISFLRYEFSKYDQILCVGSSAGGYASLLFGSLLKVSTVVTFIAQTDLQYCLDNYPGLRIDKINLRNRAKQSPDVWKKYNKICNILDNEVTYHVCYADCGEFCNKHRGRILHGPYHYDQIKNFPTVNEFKLKEDMDELIKQFLEKL